MSEPYEEDIMLEDDQRADMDNSMDLHLVFRIEDEDYAINVAEVADIITYANANVRAVPKTPSFIKGIINTHGDIIPVIDVRTKFMKPAKVYDKNNDQETCIVKVRYEDYTLGLIVDKVIGMEAIPAAQISAPPSAKLSYANQFIKSIGRVDSNVRMILSLEKLIF
jgi:purine-binding chemotaxis protein CheW